MIRVMLKMKKVRSNKMVQLIPPNNLMNFQVIESL